MKMTPKLVAETLFTALTGQMGFNGFLLKNIHGARKQKKLNEMAKHHLNYIRTATHAAGFIQKMGLDAEFFKYQEECDKELAKIAAEKGMTYGMEKP